MYMYKWHNRAQNYLLLVYFSSFLLSAIFKCFKTILINSCCTSKDSAREPKFLFVLEEIVSVGRRVIEIPKVLGAMGCVKSAKAGAARS